MKRLFYIFLFLVLFCVPLKGVLAFDLQQHVRGRILLAVESRGEAWYVNAVDGTRFYLGRPVDTLRVMSALGLGISNSDLRKIPLGVISNPTTQLDTDRDGLSDIFETSIGSNINSFDTDRDGFSDYQEVFNGFSPTSSVAGSKPAFDTVLTNRVGGRILLQVESRGEAWYVDPVQGKRFFLGDPDSAFSVLRHLGLGISNSNLSMITISSKSSSSNNSTTIPAPIITPIPGVTVNPIVTSNADYVIVVSDQLFSSALKLKQHRELDGHRVTVQPISFISKANQNNSLHLAEDVDSWIEAYALQTPTLRYVVLLGDITQLPTKQMTVVTEGSSSMDIQSDLLYAVKGQFDDEHFFPTFYFGRIPIRTTSEFDAYLDKMKKFEATFAVRKTILFFGYPGELQYASDRDIPLAQQLGFKTKMVTYDPLHNPIALYEQQLFDALNDPDLAMVLYYGHGNQTENARLHIGNINNLTNANTPIVYLSGGCGFGDSSVSVRPLSDQLLLQNSGAAVALGASKSGGYGGDYQFIPGYLRAIVSSHTVGEAMLAGLESHHAWMIEDLSPTGAHLTGNHIGYDMGFIARMSFAGDPALRIR